ncbi:MAG: phosphotransferase [Deltaproteobacteria bacterium]|nr:MAG: phosphotransferase [Deltaproteobacteria bacterium]
MTESQPHADRVRAAVRQVLDADVVELTRIDAGLGTRAFFRVRLAARTAGVPDTLVARVDAEEDPGARPLSLPPEPPLEPLRSFLAAHGLPVPKHYGSDARRGVELIECFGSRSLEAFANAATPAERGAIYREACQLVSILQGAADPSGRVPAFERRLDARYFAYKAALFARVSLPTALGRAATAAEVELVRETFAWIASVAAQVSPRLAHRDLQSANLLVREDAAPGARLGMIDFQGALLAPPEYDLVCLLRDSYVELPDAEVEQLLSATRPTLPDPPDPESFARRFDLLTLTRKGKDHARFLSAARERGDERYLRYLPATVRYLRAAASRAARRDPRLAGFEALVRALPEAPCAR